MAKRRTQLPPYVVLSFQDLWLACQKIGVTSTKEQLMAHIASWNLPVDYFAVSRASLELLAEFPSADAWVTIQVPKVDRANLEAASRAGAIPMPTDYHGPGNGGNFYFRIPAERNPLPEHTVGGRPARAKR